MTIKNHLLKIAAIALAFFSSCGGDEPEEMDCAASDLDLVIESVENAGCNTQDGSISVSGSGGSGEYMFSINGSAPVASGEFTGLGAGVYTVSVADGAGCEATKQATVSNESGLVLTIDSSPAGCGTSNGAIEATASGGTAPYMFRIGNGSFQQGGVFENLSTGTFNVTVRDGNGCESGQSVRVASGLSLAADIKPILQNNCALAGCHVGGALPDFRNSETIVANAANIRTMTSTRTMPPAESGKTLSQEQIDRIACWVADGAPNN